MNDQIIIAATLVTGLGLVVLAALHGWQGWLALKERELQRLTIHPRANSREIEDRSADGSAGVGIARIEIADLKERIRKLEAIANGVDL